MDGLKLHVVPPQWGYSDVARAVRRRIINIDQYQVIFVMIGRADMVRAVAHLQEAVDDFVSTCKRFNPEAVVVLSGPHSKAYGSQEVGREMSYRRQGHQSFRHGSLQGGFLQDSRAVLFQNWCQKHYVLRYWAVHSGVGSG